MAAFGSQVFCLFPLPTAPVAALRIDFLSAATSLFGDVLFLTSPEPSFQEQVTSWVVARLALLKAVLIFLESGNKESILMPHCRDLPPEHLAGTFGKTFFTWINPILTKGYTDILTPQDIPGLERNLSSERLRRDILRAWDQRRKPETTLTLPVTLLRFAKGAFLSAILPRMFLILFRYCQPVLINAAVRFVHNGNENSNDRNYAYWLIVISTAVYHHQLNRLRIINRSALIALLHHRALHIQSECHDNGGPITLMSVDVETLSTLGDMLHEAWAYILEVIIGTALLASQIGWLCFVPLVGVCCSSWMSACLVSLILLKPGCVISEATKYKLQYDYDALCLHITLVDRRLDIRQAQVGSGITESHERAAILLADVSIQYPHTRVCAQEPWLPSGSIKEVICGGLQIDETWYKQVLFASELLKDLDALPDGDGTEIQFPGLNLSGGQRQRVALARVLYARCEIVILDDTFRALDGKTEKAIVHNLLGPDGVFRNHGTTAIVITNSAQYFPLADHILVLSDSKIHLQGSWDKLQHDSKQIDKFMPDEREYRHISQGSEAQGSANMQKDSRVDAARDLTRQSGDSRLYGYYLNAMGVRNGLFMLMCTVSYSFFITFSQYWVKWWAEARDKQTAFYMGGYIILALIAWISTNGTMWFGEDIQLVDRQLPNDFQALGTLGTIDASQKPAYLLVCLQQWLNLVLDLVIAFVAVGLVALAVASRGTETSTAVGLSLNMIILANTTLLRLVESWTSLEVSLGAIARLRSVVTETPREESTGEQKLSPPANWPVSGSIVVHGLEASYSPPKLALQNIHLEVKAGQKLLICGRTGSGKSTLFLSFLRLLDLQHGSIMVDNINISNMSQTYLRRHCFITVPQDPFTLAEATLRFNLDPEGSLPDTVLIDVLEKTRLWEHICQFSNLNQRKSSEIEALLDLPMSSLPPLSAGQQQSLSLSRALARKEAFTAPEYSDLQTRLSVAERRPILLLDEATSALDPHTEAVMQDVIEEEFTQKGYTVIVVAHRVGGMVQYFRDGIDAVVWMSEGRIERVVRTQAAVGLALKDDRGGGSNLCSTDLP
ncbi:hypothetical protein BDV24DRAFT_178254 [Aspergillus arachidicola]|uniref:ABC transporter domain-containing protein n=1 Tax=Aspergillus arachidicola TaxID=656916 RepID=A0A5N6YLN3_9EURO|nr:hypothetical protein BDV24DRAFT_178254 [Aspergillus arachidicola]